MMLRIFAWIAGSSAAIADCRLGCFAGFAGFVVGEREPGHPCPQTHMFHASNMGGIDTLSKSETKGTLQIGSKKNLSGHAEQQT